MSLALNFTATASAVSKPLFGNGHSKSFQPKDKHLLKSLQSSSYTRLAAAAQPEGTQGRVAEERENPAPDDDDDDDYDDDASTGLFTSTRAQLDLLQQLTSSSPSSSGYDSDSSSSWRGTIREQLARLVGDRDDDFSIPLGKDLKKVSPKFLTTSQRRNIRRQAYLNEVSKRNDSVFFASIGAFVILPPFVILGIAVLTGYVQLFP